MTAYLATLGEEDRAFFGKVRRLLKASHPRVVESMQYRMPTYVAGGQPYVGFNRQKHYLCVYVNPDALTPFRAELAAAGLDCGKCCIRFRRPEKLPFPLLRRIVKEAARLARKLERDCGKKKGSP